MSKKNEIIRQLEKLDEFADTKRNLSIDDSWKAQLKQIIITHIDENSPFLDRIDEIKFFVLSTEKPSQEYFKQQYDQSKHNASLLIFNIKTYIENNGLKKRPNFICRLSETWATTLTTIVLISWSYFCFTFGQNTTQNKIDNEKISLERQIDSLTATIHSFTLSNAKPKMSITPKNKP